MVTLSYFQIITAKKVIFVFCDSSTLLKDRMICGCNVHSEPRSKSHFGWMRALINEIFSIIQRRVFASRGTGVCPWYPSPRPRPPNPTFSLPPPGACLTISLGDWSEGGGTSTSLFYFHFQSYHGRSYFALPKWKRSLTIVRGKRNTAN
jgi:hypothetical protein